jgi:uncharacterized delta-60 repeat protein
MKTFNLILTILFINCSISFAQVSQQWAARYSYTSGTDKATSLAVDASGNVYVTGSSSSGGYGTEDYTTIKYNSAGTVLWTKRYNGPAGGSDIANAIAVDASGNVYVTGSSAAANWAPDYLTIKYNSAGDTVWTKRYNGTRDANDIAYSIAIDTSGNVYVTGSSEGLVGTHGIFEDYVTVKYNSAGVQQWAASYNGPGGDFDAAYSIAVDGSGNVYVTGESGGGSGGSGFPYQDYATIKYNSAGVFQWVARYNGTTTTSNDKANQLKVDASGNVYVTGKSYGAGLSDDYLTIKYNTGGTLMWTARYDGTVNNTDEATSLDVDRTGNVYVTGISYSGSASGYDIVTVKYDMAGIQQWSVSYNGPASGNDGGSKIAVDTAGNAYVTGYSMGAGALDLDYATMKYNTSGVLQWVMRYTNGGGAGSTEEAADIKVDNSGNVYITGMSALDYATVKYSAVTGINPVSNEAPEKFSLSQNYPNPFNPTTNIKFNVTKEGNVKLTVFDIAGRVVETLVDRVLQAGVYEFNFNASSLSSGVYFYRLTAGDFSDVKKMSLIK